MKLRWIKFFSDEWLGGCVMLDNAERGLYITACALIYSSPDGYITHDHLRAACRDHGHAFNRQLSRLVALGKLEVSDDQITNKRATKELKNADKMSENGRQNVAKRWENNDLENVSVLHARAKNQNQNKEADRGKPLSDADASAKAPNGVDALWHRGLAILGEDRRSLLGKYRKTYGDVVVLAAIVECEKEQPSEPASFFVACCDRRKTPEQKYKRPGSGFGSPGFA